jgi:hypothetical protein
MIADGVDTAVTALVIIVIETQTLLKGVLFCQK